jgi:hypothetical protein
MTLATHEFICRFLMHVLPAGFKAANTNADQPPEHRCPCCGGRMMIIERFERGSTPHYHASPPTPMIRIDTS